MRHSRLRSGLFYPLSPGNGYSKACHPILREASLIVDTRNALGQFRDEKIYSLQ